MKRTSLVLVALALTACTNRPNLIPLAAASPDDLGALQGRWSGSYVGFESGRRGTISFELTAGSDTARGEVLMLPEGIQTPVMRTLEVSDPRSERIRPSSEMLTIAFVRIQGGQVSGKLDPYRDPGCGCIVNTTFTGVLRDSSTLEGTFVTTANGLFTTQRGDWRVKRVKP